MRTKTACSSPTSASESAGSPRRLQELAVGGAGALERERDQGRRLALPEVVADRLAGDLRVAERAQDVVAELERVAEREPDRGERRPERCEPARERGAEVQRSLDRVLPGLVDGDAVREPGLGARRGGTGQVERLADAQLDPQLVEHAVGRVGHAPHQHVGVGEREVADQDRHALAEPPRLTAPSGAPMSLLEPRVDRRVAAPHARAVHHVVVREGERVHQLEGGGGVDDPRIVPFAVGADERAVTERGPQALASGRDEIAQRFDRFRETAVDGPPPRELGREQIVDAPFDLRRERHERGREHRLLRAGRGHAGTVVAPGHRDPNAPAYAAPVSDFLSTAWLRELDAAVRAVAGTSALAPIVIEQVVDDVPGRGCVRYRFHVDEQGAGVAEPPFPDAEGSASPDVRLTTDYPTAVAIARGTENAQIALSRGRLRLGGDIDTLVRRADALGALGDATAALRAATTYPSP